MELGQGQVHSCSHCNISFQSDQIYKQHYKSELHKYNLKRKLLDLAPITQEQFNFQFNKEKSETSVYSRQLYCMPCGKSFDTKNTLNQHLRSKKHAERVIQHNKKWNQQGKDSESDTTQSKSIQRLSNEDVSVCLFCDSKLSNIEANIEHMQQQHGFVITQQKYVNNMKGLIAFLGRQINEQKGCLVCVKDFKSNDALKKHMIDKQHCVMPSLSSDEAQYLAYYDFTQKIQEIPEVDEEYEIIQDTTEHDKETTVYQQKQEENPQVIQIDESQSISEWEFHEEDEKEVDIEVKKEEFQSFLKSLQQKIEFTDDDGVKLENGKVIGHRDYRVIYKQYLRDYQEFQIKNQQKMLGDTQKHFQLRQISHQSIMNSEEQQNLTKKEKSKQIKEQNINVPKDATQKNKSQLGSDKFNGSLKIVNGGKKLRI